MPRIRPAESMPPVPDDADRATRIQMASTAIIAHRPEIATAPGRRDRRPGHDGHPRRPG